MKRRSKAMGTRSSLKMGFLMRLLIFTFIGRAIALATSDVSFENPSTIANEIKNSNKTNPSSGSSRISPAESNDLLNRKSRAIPVSESSEENILETDQMNDKTFIISISDDVDKRAIPMMRYGRSGASMIPAPRFGRSGASMIPAPRFGRSGGSMIPAPRFGKSDSSMIPAMRFGRSDSSMIPTIRFGRSDSSMIPAMRFGRSDSSMIPAMRFGRSDSSMIPTMRFGRSDSSMIPTMRFGRSDSSMIPMIRFGRSDPSMIPTMRFGRSDNSMIPIPRFGRTFEHYGSSSSVEDESHEDQNLNMEQDIDKSNSVMSYSKLGGDAGMDSEKTSNSLEFVNRILKRDTNDSNDSIIPQIRYGRSSVKANKIKETKPQYFMLPNIRPGRSSNENVVTSEETPYFSDVQGFLGLFGAFRRSDDDIKDDSRNLQDMELGNKVEDLLLDANADKNLYKYNKDPVYVIPYPRPGKRQLGKYPSLQKDTEKSNGKSSPHLFKINTISDYVLPYPRPGKKSQGTESIQYIRSKRSTSIPYPRPGRSYSVLPYPKPGSSTVMLPYPRPGRSSAEEDNYMLPYPRPGKSKQSSFSDYTKSNLDHQNQSKRTKRSAENYELAYMFSPETKKNSGNSNFEHFQVGDENESKLLEESHDLNNFLKTLKGHETNSAYMLPYPRPGRVV